MIRIGKDGRSVSTLGRNLSLCLEAADRMMEVGIRKLSSCRRAGASIAGDSRKAELLGAGRRQIASRTEVLS